MLQKRADPVKTSIHGLGWVDTSNIHTCMCVTFLSFSTGQVMLHPCIQKTVVPNPSKQKQQTLSKQVCMAWAGLGWATSIGLMEQSDTSNIHTYFTQSYSRPCQGKYGYLKWMGHDENGILHCVAWLVVIVIGCLRWRWRVVGCEAVLVVENARAICGSQIAGTKGLISVDRRTSLLSYLQYPVPYQSRLQRIYRSQCPKGD